MSKLASLYIKYLKIIARQKWKYAASWFFLLALLVVSNISVFLIGSLIDKVSDDKDQLSRVVILISVVMAMPLLLEPATFFLKSRIYSTATAQITTQAYSNVLKQDYDLHANRQTGKLISIIINSSQILDMFLWRLEWFFLENLSSLLIPIFLIGIISPQIALSICGVIIVLSPLIFWSLKVNIRRRTALKEADYLKNNAIIDGVSNFETVRSFGTEHRETTNFFEIMKRQAKAMNRYQDSFRLVDFLSRLLAICVFATGASLTVYYYERDVITLGFVVVIVSYLISMSKSTMNMVFSFRDVIKETPVVEDFYELYNSVPTILESSDPHYLQEPKGDVEFRNVDFSYKGEQAVINNFSATIQAGQNIALVGSSGGGKSTITRLLMRYYDVESGEVLIDGVNVKNLALDSLRSIIGIVPQEPVLFNRSILYNVGYALDGINDVTTQIEQQIIDACKQAHVHDFIASLPDGYNTVVGERGIKLSGGQKQRLAIARVLLKNPKIIIFDEATSMLDSESEKAIQSAFKVMSKDKTVIIIAHRLSTIIHCDKILVIDKGRVAESGVHESLIAQKGIYAKLWQIQSGGFKKS